ncbi:A-agglutinin anchorage subunit-like [Papaver somniferum]|uniref:A-agglutinin anchorage subunit-like n=1 Tax=Papaver somniferum TaxID=3469 RepID=UPI000E702533|nr:A-agglutinin anchorage subunit-like [Papaver somniferum]
MVLHSFKNKPSSTQKVSSGGTAPFIRVNTIASDQANITTSSPSTTSSQANTIACSSSSTSIDNAVQNPSKDLISFTSLNLSSPLGMISTSQDLVASTQAITFSAQEVISFMQDMPISASSTIPVPADYPTFSYSSTATTISSISTVLTTSPLRTDASAQARTIMPEACASNVVSSRTRPLLDSFQLARSSSNDPSQLRLCESLVKLLGDSPSDKLARSEIFAQLDPSFSDAFECLESRCRFIQAEGFS